VINPERLTLHFLEIPEAEEADHQQDNKGNGEPNADALADEKIFRKHLATLDFKAN
jgi:hypothetical protein